MVCPAIFSTTPSGNVVVGKLRWASRKDGAETPSRNSQEKHHVETSFSYLYVHGMNCRQPLSPASYTPTSTFNMCCSTCTMATCSQSNAPQSPARLSSNPTHRMCLIHRSRTLPPPSSFIHRTLLVSTLIRRLWPFILTVCTVVNRWLPQIHPLAAQAISITGRMSPLKE